MPGYLNRPETTAERFIDHPLPTNGHRRLYRTGDLACYRPDGNLQFMGRVDHQVKIRGYRIELGEIETVLSNHAQVREAVVIAREDVPGDTRLAAYLVPSARATPASSDLRRYIQEKLPEFMVPSHFRYP